jgi:hypothetical protein
MTLTIDQLQYIKSILELQRERNHTLRGEIRDMKVEQQLSDALYDIAAAIRNTPRRLVVSLPHRWEVGA